MKMKWTSAELNGSIATTVLRYQTAALTQMNRPRCGEEQNVTAIHATWPMTRVQTEQPIRMTLWTDAVHIAASGNEWTTKEVLTETEWKE